MANEAIRIALKAGNKDAFEAASVACPQFLAPSTGGIQVKNKHGLRAGPIASLFCLSLALIFSLFHAADA